jgi:hypothetical protein
MAEGTNVGRAGGRVAVNWRRHYDLAQRRRGAELFAIKEHFFGRCFLMIVFTLRHCASARKIRRAGGRAVNWRKHCDLAQRRRAFCNERAFLGEVVS